MSEQSPITGLPNMLAGMPVIRDGDNVFLINKQSHWEKTIAAQEAMSRRLELLWSEYSCPFSILYEFDKWFEWHKRLRFDKQPTGEIMRAMIGDDFDRANKHKLPVKSLFCSNNFAGARMDDMMFRNQYAGISYYS